MNPRYGKPVPIEQIEKMLRTVELTKVHIELYDMAGNFIKEYVYMKDVVDDGYDWTCVSKCCRGLHKTHKNMVFKYKK